MTQGKLIAGALTLLASAELVDSLTSYLRARKSQKPRCATVWSDAARRMATFSSLAYSISRFSFYNRPYYGSSHSTTSLFPRPPEYWPGLQRKLPLAPPRRQDSLQLLLLFAFRVSPKIGENDW